MWVPAPTVQFSPMKTCASMTQPSPMTAFFSMTV